MRGTISVLLLGVMICVSCRKENPGNDNPVVKLSATTFYNNGEEETRYERSGNIERNSSAGVINDGTGEGFLLNLGTAGSSVFGVSFLFGNRVSPAAITGDHDFPVAESVIRVTLRNDIAVNNTELLSNPRRGKLVISYDTANGRISGSVRDLEFPVLSGDRYRITINGSFGNIPAR